MSTIRLTCNLTLHGIWVRQFCCYDDDMAIINGKILCSEANHLRLDL